jgi:uncharacterized membrane protein affecting hemolysin expression
MWGVMRTWVHVKRAQTTLSSGRRTRKKKRKMKQMKKKSKKKTKKKKRKKQCALVFASVLGPLGP